MRIGMVSIGQPWYGEILPVEVNRIFFMTVINIISFCFSVVAYSLKELQSHGKLKWMKEDKPFSFFGKLSYRRKYKKLNSASGERWPTSTNLTVMFTDFYHLMQFAFKLFIILTLVTYEPIFNMVWDFIIYFLLFGVTFTAVYKLLSK